MDPTTVEQRALTTADYTVGWISALAVERAAAEAMLDEEHEKPGDFSRPAADKNSYSWGRIGVHNIVIAALPAGMYGQVSAASVAKDMAASFPQIRVGLLVGIGGGIPQPEREIDIRLGDIVVSEPSGQNGGVVQYDAGKATAAGFELKGFLNAPPTALLNATTKLKARHQRKAPRVAQIMQDMLARNTRMARRRPGNPSYAYQGAEHDRLFRAECGHVGGKNCDGCDASQEIERERDTTDPEIHYGVIASGSAVIKDAAERAEVLRRVGDCLCVETEAAGLMNHFPCLVIRGICDYADTHKNDRWQPYAAATAAAYTKELLGVLDGEEVESTRRVVDVLDGSTKFLNLCFTMVLTSCLVHEAVQGLSRGRYYDQIEKWLSPADPSTNYNEASRMRHKDTGSWLLEDTRYTSWKESPASFLWLYGIPGCGKTVLSSTIIKNLQEDPDMTTLLYFFFSFTDNQKQSPQQLICSLASQLYHASEANARSCLDGCFTSHKYGREQPSFSSLCATFQKMAEQAGELWVVLDALDECPGIDQRGVLLDWIEVISQNSNVHLLITSRREEDIYSAVHRWAPAQSLISLESGLLHADIASYIQSEVRNAKRLKRWHRRPDVQQEMEQVLLEGAGGMYELHILFTKWWLTCNRFRWVSCQLDELGRCLDYPSVQETLTSLPKTLDDTYSRILSNIPKGYVPNAKRLLQFLTYSKRPLRVEEAVDIVAVQSQRKPHFDKKNRMPEPREIASYCASLITITARPRGRTLRANFRYGYSKDKHDEEQVVLEIQLAHFSVQSYLISSQVEPSFAKDLYEPVAMMVVAETCLAYLLELEDGLGVDQVYTSYPFAEFAARYWAEYAAEYCMNSNDLHNLAMKLFANRRIYRLCLELYDPDGRWDPFYADSDSDDSDDEGDWGMNGPLYYAALCGLCSCVENLLSLGFNPNARGIEHGNALQAASAQGHLSIVQALIDGGADVNAHDGEQGNALQAATGEGHLDVVQALLDRGADINAQVEDYGNALQAACTGGRLDIVQFLLDRGADINAQGGEYGSALQAASAEGHIDIVQYLLARGADTSVHGGYYGDALQAAASKGHGEIVEMLLDHGADVNAQIGPQAGALQGASTFGHLDIVYTLLDHGADVNMQGGYYGTPLQAASARGHFEISRTLLRHGANVNAQGGHHGNALRAASSQGHGYIARHLLAAGAIVTKPVGDAGSSPHAASETGHDDAALEQDVDFGPCLSSLSPASEEEARKQALAALHNIQYGLDVKTSKRVKTYHSE